MSELVKERTSIGAYLAIARVDHWFKQVFCIPGAILAISLDHTPITASALVNLLIGFLGISFTASSNYVINEILDAPFDLSHPDKRNRPIPSGRVQLGWAYAEWLVLAVIGLWLSWCVNVPFFATSVWLWVMGLIYNVRPVRAKDLPVGDVLSESINNPIRLLAGWYALGAGRVAPLSVLCAYWMLGTFLMTAKRYAEYRHIGNKAAAAAYRRSFAYYTESRLRALMVFFASSFSLFLGIFLIKYRVELILVVPLIAALITVYWSTSELPNSPVQYPEKLYRQKGLMVVCFALAIVGTVLLFVDLPFLAGYFEVFVPQRS